MKEIRHADVLISITEHAYRKFSLKAQQNAAELVQFFLRESATPSVQILQEIFSYAV